MGLAARAEGWKIRRSADKWGQSKNELIEGRAIDGDWYVKIDEAGLEAEKAQAAAAPQVSFGQIKADLQEINIKVFMPLWDGGYKIIDQEGVEHRLEDGSQLMTCYKKVMNK
jgi:hypothetical protein